jgi:hypothetical protein
VARRRCGASGSRCGTVGDTSSEVDWRTSWRIDDVVGWLHGTAHRSGTSCRLCLPRGLPTMSPEMPELSRGRGDRSPGALRDDADEAVEGCHDLPGGTPATAGRRQDSTLHQPGAIALATPIVTANMQAKAVIRAQLNRLEWGCSGYTQGRRRRGSSL